ncbi:hypothetical protein F1D05_32930 [Kribbella qitaiheensis]|uniref:Tachylectin 2 domain-containing protein n=1 Tax=Kribbella qitaiheensis TaxID=1544730 RepID=A0A7G6X6I2_9ACTN|nr:hypothetical protein [Kribbella qitaiheensis]QNE21847.1 hypothetical protein F1D05_32930 [Kribbella qitaiheensis]
MRKPFVAALALAAIGSALTALPASAAIADVPADCGTYTTAYRSDGQRLAYGYDARKTSITSYPGDKLTWVPSAWQQLGGAGDVDLFISSELAAHPTDGYLYDVERRGERTNGVWKMTKNTAIRITAGFGGTRILANGTYLYRVAGTSLYRYSVSFVNGEWVLSAPVTLRSTSWDTVKTLTFERTEGTGSAAVDVLVGTKTNGELKEWRINLANPSTIGSTVLQSTGWSGFSSLSTGYCQSHPNGRPLLGITSAGAASVYFDANQSDRLGTDIKGGSLGSLGWTAKSYGQ